MSEHTPGPWTLFERRSRLLIIAADPKYGCVAEAFIYAGGGDEPDTSEANARLISCAPKLLERLEEMNLFLKAERDSFYKSISTPDGEVPDEHDQRALAAMDGDIRKNLEVIARAKGEQP